MNIIDPHLHLFDLAKGDYLWLRPENPPHWPDKSIIYRDFTEQDLQLGSSFTSPQSSPLSLSGFVHIEAGFDNAKPWRELQWLESHCQLSFKAVACADITLTEQEFIAQISELQQYSSLVGVRHILDQQASSILSQPQVSNNLSYLASQNLSFDCQLPLTDNPAVKLLCQVLDITPKLTCVINHAGFSPLKNSKQQYQHWHNNLQRLAQYPRLAIKCSGWEMQNRNYQQADIQQITATSIKLLGDNRVMLASNFPLTLFSRSYQDYWQTVTQLFSQSLATQLCYANALHWYKFSND